MPDEEGLVSEADLRDVPLAELRKNLSPRSNELDRHHVTILSEVFDQLPPVVVHRESLTLVDGAHRVAAARLLKRSTIRALLVESSLEDAMVEAIRLNVCHGKPLTRQERRAAVGRVLSVKPEWSDRRIAETCGVSPRTVASARRE